MAGRTMTVTMGVYGDEGDCPECDAFAAEVSNQLRPIGIDVELQRSDDPWGDAFRPDTSIDIIEVSIGSAFPDVGAFLRSLPDQSWIDASSAAEIERLQALAGRDRFDAAAAVARHVSDESHLIIPYGRWEYANYFASDIGCAFVQPAVSAVDLLSLCRLDETGERP
jgi:hypothetical protein